MSRKKKDRYNKYFSPGTRSSITGFSKNATGASKRRKSYTERRRNRGLGIAAACILGAALVFTAAFFVTDTLLDISHAQVESTTPDGTQAGEQPSESQGQTQAPQAAGIELSSLRARVADVSLLDAGAALDSYISALKNEGFNAVVIDFKDETGYLSYPSAIEAVSGTDIVSRTHTNAAGAVSRFKESGIAVVARVYCFKDSLMPRTDRSAAAHYLNTASLWLDDEPSRGGRPWLNPYARPAVAYLTAVVGEVGALGVDCILLDGVQFPDLLSSAATFDGESASGAPGRNEVLVGFVNSCVSAAGSTPVICTMKGEAAAGGSNAIYDGSLWASDAAAFAADITSLSTNANVNYPQAKTVVEIRASAQDARGAYIIQN